MKDVLRAASPRAAPAPQLRWFILAVLVLARTTVAFQFQSLAAIGPEVVERYGIDYGALGALIGLYMLAGVVIALPGGLLGQRFGDRRTALAGLTLMIVGGLLMMVGEEPAFLVAGRLASGVGAILLNVLVAKMVADWFASRDTALAMAFFLSSWPVGLALALVALPPLAAASGVNAALMLTVVFCAAAALALFLFYRSPDGAAAPLTFRIALSRREWILAVHVGGIWALFNAGLILFVAFGPSLLAERGHSLAAAGWITSLAMWAVAPAMVFGGALFERLPRPEPAIGLSFALAALALVGFAAGGTPILWSLLLGLLAAPAGMIMKMAVGVLSPRNRAVGMGVFFSCYYATMAITPAVAGYLREATGDAGAPILVAAICYLATTGLVLLFPAVARSLRDERPAQVAR